MTNYSFTVTISGGSITAHRAEAVSREIIAAILEDQGDDYAGWAFTYALDFSEVTAS